MNCKQLLSIGFIPLFIILQGCQKQTVAEKPKLSCADSSMVKLDAADVKDIVLTPTVTSYAGVAGNNRSKGYKFVGKKGQKISFNTQPNGFCTWLYFNNQIINEPILPQDGSYMIQVAAAENSGTFEMRMSLGSDNSSSLSTPPTASIPNESSSSSPPSSPEEKASPSPMTSISSESSSPSPPSLPKEEASPSPTTSISSDLTKEEITKIIRTWLEAKKSIFGSSYAKEIGKELTIGEAYERTITAKNGDEESSVDYLKKWGKYYTYQDQEIQDILFVKPLSSDKVLVKLLVSESLTLHNADGTEEKDEAKNRKSCYLLQKDNNSWKIAKTPVLFKSCSKSKFY